MSTSIKPLSSNQQNSKVLMNSCLVNEILRKISTRWKMQLLFSIMEGDAQFSKLKRKFSSLSDQVLSKRLRELEFEGLIDKYIHVDLHPQRVTYKVTDQALKLLEILEALCAWGKQQTIMSTELISA